MGPCFGSDCLPDLFWPGAAIKGCHSLSSSQPSLSIPQLLRKCYPSPATAMSVAAACSAELWLPTPSAEMCWWAASQGCKTIPQHFPGSKGSAVVRGHSRASLDLPAPNDCPPEPQVLCTNGHSAHLLSPASEREKESGPHVPQLNPTAPPSLCYPWLHSGRGILCPGVRRTCAQQTHEGQGDFQAGGRHTGPW